jgi:hypothetical protein
LLSFSKGSNGCVMEEFSTNREIGKNRQNQAAAKLRSVLLG